MPCLLVPLSQDIPYTAISSFIFLRFFIPAILSPKLFSLRELHPDQRTERTLKLVSKVCVSVCASMNTGLLYLYTFEFRWDTVHGGPCLAFVVHGMSKVAASDLLP